VLEPPAASTCFLTVSNSSASPSLRHFCRARKLLRDAEATPAHPVTKLALRLLALTVVRPGVLRGTPWTEFPENADPIWRVPAERMKLKKQHKQDETREFWVPLSRQALEIIEVMRALTGRGPLVFPSARHAYRPMSENAIGYLLNRAGYHGKQVPHGWRSTFSTIMNERFVEDRAIVDLMLAHAPKDKVEGAYNRAAYMPRRVELAQIWADLLMEGMPAAAELKLGPQR